MYLVKTLINHLQTYKFISFITRRIKLKIIHKITKTQSHQISVSLRLHVSKPTNQLLTINYTLFIVHCSLQITSSALQSVVQGL